MNPRHTYLVHAPRDKFLRIITVHTYSHCVISNGIAHYCRTVNGALREARRETRMGFEVLILPTIEVNINGPV